MYPGPGTGTIIQSAPVYNTQGKMYGDVVIVVNEGIVRTEKQKVNILTRIVKSSNVPYKLSLVVCKFGVSFALALLPNWTLIDKGENVTQPNQ